MLRRQQPGCLDLLKLMGECFFTDKRTGDSKGKAGEFLKL